MSAYDYDSSLRQQGSLFPYKQENVFSLFPCYHPWKRIWPFIWTNLNPLHPRMLCAKFGRNWPSGSGEKDFKIFAISLLSPLRKGHGLSFEKNLTPLHPRMLCAKFGWYWPSGSGEGNENLNKCIWAFSIGELPRFGLSRGVGLFKLSIARGRAGWRTLHVYVAVRLCQNWQTMDCRTMDLSDYRTFGLWSCWIIGLFDYGSSCWTIIGLSDYWAVGL